MSKGIFGSYRISAEIKVASIGIEVKKEGTGFLYRRLQGEVVVEKYIFPLAGSKLLLLPVEPINLPGELADQLYISLNKPIMVPPGGMAKVYLKFPVEVAVFFQGQEKKKLLDIFTLAREKLTFSGDFEKGHISRYYESEIFSDVPEADPTIEGIIYLFVRNRSDGWEDVEKLILPATDMKIYYNERLVSMMATLTILKHNLARVKIKDSPLKKGMKKSEELYKRGALRKVTERFAVEAE